MSGNVNCHACRYEYPDSALFCANCGAAKVREVATDKLLGKILGDRFLIQEKLGEGTSGNIYRAEHITLRRRVAVKVLHHELSRDDLALERFRREATSVGELDNEHLVEIHDFGRTDDGRLYLAMELLDGETLDVVIAREHTLSFERTTDILIQVGDALADAHAIGFIHRDLRPRNVFLAVRRGQANFVKLFDFGLAKLVEPDAQAASTSLGMTFGDPRYMSPEQARGDRIDQRADIYQLGCVAYEMLTGAPPFVGDRVFEVLTKHVSDAPTPLPTKRPGVPLWLESVVTRMLAKQPSNRFATVTRMVEALRLGQSTGEVMPEARATRRETQPPGAVSRAIAKVGTVPVDADRHELKPAAPSPLTVSANAAASVSQVSSAIGPTASGEVSAPVKDVPKPRTPTPRAGVPIVQTTESPSTGTESATDTGKLPRPAPSYAGEESADDDTDGKESLTDSGAWFADGDRQSADDELAVSQLAAKKRRERARKLVTPTWQPPPGASASFDEEFVPQRNRRPLFAAVGVGAIVIVSVIIYMVTHSGGPAETTFAIAQPPDARPVVIPDAMAVPLVDAAPIVVDAARSGKTPSSAGSGNTIDMGVGNTKIIPTVTPPKPPQKPPENRTPTPDARPRTVDPSGNTGPLDPYAPTGGGADPVDPYSSATPDPSTARTEAAQYASAGDRSLRSGDAATAAANYKRALELDSSNLSATIGLGEVAAQQGLSRDALTHLKKAAKLAPRSARVQILLGEAYLNTNDKSAAATAFRKALQLDPDSTRAQNGLSDATGA